MKITANKFVAVTYDLNVGEGEERELMERATAETPLKFIFGTGAMLPAFEDALKGLEVGDKFNFSITPAGHPSITPPIPGPCDSPKEVSLYMFPNVFTLAKIVNCQFFNGIRHIRIHFRGYGRHHPDGTGNRQYGR